MGMFSYDCSHCGKNDQFDFVDSCVVKIGNDVYVKGSYDSYGKVRVFLSDDTDPAEVKLFKKFQKKCKKDGISLVTGWENKADGCKNGQVPNDTGGRVIEVNLEQFEEYFGCWHMQCGGGYFSVVEGSVLASDIWCAGEGEESDEKKMSSNQQISQMAKAHLGALYSLMGGGFGDDFHGDGRNCVPDGIEVRDYLRKTEIEDLPKAKIPKEKGKKRKSTETLSERDAKLWEETKEESYARIGIDMSCM
jgi:hypothetical protein